uniref:Mitochondrial inner membrane protease subunit n=1 Tax=Felis catus TaxID=9685 RepID=A0ABI7WEJ0_FELCA
MAQSKGWVRRYFKAFCKGFFVAVPVAVTFLDRVACVARVEGASMQPSLNPGGSQSSDVVLLNHWKVRNFEVQRGDIVSLVSPKNPEQKIIKRVIALEGDIVKTMGHKNRYVKVPRGHIWVEGDHHGHSFDSNSFGPKIALHGILLPMKVRNFEMSFVLLRLFVFHRFLPSLPLFSFPLLFTAHRYIEQNVLAIA